jgi:tripartite-type tricarboxylate transporter receptor subunit TctC
MCGSAARHFALIGLMFAGASIMSSAAFAQSYPSRPVRIVSAFAAGGTNDIIARIISPRFSELLGQQIIVENRPGAGGVIGTEMVAKAPADGYTLTIATSTTHAIAPALRKLPYDPVKDFSPVGLIGVTPYVVIVHPTLPVKSIKELVALAKARSGQVEFGSGGIGTPGHLAGAMLNSMTGTKLVHVPYKAGNLALNDLLGGHISMTFSTTITSTQFIQSKRVRALAVTSAKRVPAFPELPTVAESGVPGYEFTLWLGLAAPAGTPQEIIQRLSDTLVKTVQTPDVRTKLLAQSVEPVSTTPKELTDRIARELVIYVKVVKESGATAE